MPDITMCNGEDCPIKDTCYRFKAKASSYQSFFSGQPYEVDLGGEFTGCNYHWKMDEVDGE